MIYGLPAEFLFRSFDFSELRNNHECFVFPLMEISIVRVHGDHM